MNYYDKPREEASGGSGSKAAAKGASDDIKAKDWLGQTVLCQLCTLLEKLNDDT